MNKLLSSIVFAAAFAGVSIAQQGGAVYLVHTAKPVRQSIERVSRITGSVVSPAEVSVASRVSGRLLTLEKSVEGGEAIRLDEGVIVKKGDRIAVIESKDYEAQLAAAEAAVLSAKVSLKDAKREFDRTAELFKGGTATEQERDTAEANYERAVAALAKVEAERDLAKINLDECVITAPMDGVVSKRSVEPGSLLSAGTELAVITAIDPVRFQMSVPTTYYANLIAGKTEVTIEVDAYPGEPVDAVISRIYPVANNNTRTLLVECTIPNGDGRFLPGMYAVGAIALESREDVLVVPYDAVIRNDKERIIYREKNGVAEAVKVKLGIRSDALVEVVEGLSESDEIVVAGQHRLTDGAKIKREVIK